ncbi:MAG: succinylglutamate desuccinylase/aspartoacylase family protein [Candidatus Thorarchaeota archaeon]
MVKPTVDVLDLDPKTGTTLGFYTFGQQRPNVLIVSGMTGLSATDVYANYLIMKHFQELARVDGSVTLLPVASPLAFRLGTRISPLDSKNLDSVFPGDEHGTVTQRIAWEIWRRVSQADCVIHLRTGVQACVSHVVALHRDYIHVRNLASQISLPLVAQSLGQRGALSTEAAHEGIPVATIEMRGERSYTDTQAAVEVREAILNYLRIRNMIPGDSIEASSIFTGRMRQVNAETEGFFIPTAHLGEEIRSGNVVGHVQDKSEVTCPYDGTVVSCSRMTYVFEGDLIARVAAPLVDQPLERDADVSPSEPPRRKW